MPQGYHPNFSVAVLDESGHAIRLEAVITGPDSVQRRVNIDINAREKHVPANWPEIAAAEADYQRGVSSQANSFRPW